MRSTNVYLRNYGGPEVLELESTQLGSPGPDQLLVRHTMASVNFIDIYHRTGAFPLPRLPMGLGVEAVGVVEAVGEAVNSLRPSDRVAYTYSEPGSYAVRRIVPAARAVRLPESVTDEQVAAVYFRGVTAHMLVRFSYVVKPGDLVLVHAAASGVGALVTRWAKHLGATVIGTVSRQDRLASANAAGADHALVSGAPDTLDAIKTISAGQGVSVVFDGVGSATYALTLAALRPFGTWVSFGQASGPLPRIDALDLGPRKSLNFARPGVFAYTAERSRLCQATDAVFDLMDRKVLTCSVARRFALEQVAEAHTAFENGTSPGPILLVPSCDLVQP